MDAEKVLRKEVKKYIDTADEKIVRMVHVLLEEDANNNWWDTMPQKIKDDVNASIEQSKLGKTIPHKEAQKRYAKWIVT